MLKLSEMEGLDPKRMEKKTEQPQSWYRLPNLLHWAVQGKNIEKLCMSPSKSVATFRLIWIPEVIKYLEAGLILFFYFFLTSPTIKA